MGILALKIMVVIYVVGIIACIGGLISKWWH